VLTPLDANAGCGRCGHGPSADATAGGCGAGCCGKGSGPGHGAARHGGGGGYGRGTDHQGIHALLDRHDAIERTVEEIEGGVVTVTTSEDPEVAEMIRTHVRSMKRRVDSGHGMRWWDPVFAELFRNHENIAMEIEDVPGGVRVRETSDDPYTAKLIRQHAVRGVSEFVAEGHERARWPTPLPDTE
jgi:hypothetical protein